MGKPRLIILIRHAQSEGNKNREIHQTVPDHRVKLTPEGRKQALEAGHKLRSLLRPDDTLHFYTSPYRRTRETTEGILSTLTADSPTPSPFPRHTIKVYEEPRLREQDFGNFQPCSAEMTRMWQERADYGHFFYRIPNGESAADAYDRISGFNESLWRSFGEDDFASVCVLVTHGLMTRVFLMKWYHWSVEYFEDLRNINHCEFIVMQKDLDNGKYILKNQLRTWTQYKREREEERAAAEQLENSRHQVAGSPIPVRKRWGGCPDGCDHTTHVARPPRRQNTADLFRDDGVASMQHLEAAIHKKTSVSAIQPPPFGSSEKPPTRGRGDSHAGKSSTLANIPDAPSTPITPTVNAPQRDSPSNKVAVQHRGSVSARDRLISPNRLAVLRAGRDGGGSDSGNGSRVGSSEEEDEGEDDDDEEDDENKDSNGVKDGKRIAKTRTKGKSSALPASDGQQQEGEKGENGNEHEEEERAKQFRPPRSMALALKGAFDDERRGSGMHSGAMADALGDQSDMSEDDDEEGDGEGEAWRDETGERDGDEGEEGEEGEEGGEGKGKGGKSAVRRAVQVAKRAEDSFEGSVR